MIEYIVKKIVCGKINDLLKTHKGNVEKLRVNLKVWIGRV